MVADGKTADRTLRAAGQNKSRRRGVQGSFTPLTSHHHQAGEEKSESVYQISDIRAY